ncbi:uncharacterized protein CcaverHIS019_0306120 [Cutaneotrichosporon cavernicola]|uniref:Uncharacterized protein n=1 Tax=Cutaneotrichosporon cavernicola TaxID=279322 RepID=A0AA48ICU3_9TREE|nr:uncharacterized protein CcaverHIS019_0306120 [Cutaneotrichosporon cavernicola]BEI90542.1 hypothetical protein CcaverHIS019_0306120 [Cutaneotrichosporon cavernicola]BEI98316.1 hypothetical protein CcaverHIS631_0306150 [Cutaneotrichosporon cavernicola]BEJ06092.1 hypothetical protein CcaverHIS641_0306140 [Cutaneotrichosporon cavernicola]
MLPNNGQRQRGAAPQNRQISALSGSRRPASGPPDPFPPPSSTQQGYAIPPSSQGYRQTHQQPLSTQYDVEDDFVESQRPMIPEYRATPPQPTIPEYRSTPQQPTIPEYRSTPQQPTIPEYRSTPQQHYPSPQTPMPPRTSRPDRQAGFYSEAGAPPPSQRRVAEVYADHVTPRSSPNMARRASAVPSEQGGKGAELSPKVDDLVNQSRNLRDATHEIKESLKVLPTREEIKADMNDSLGQALGRFKNEITESFKEVLSERHRDLKKHVDEELRPVKENVSRILSALALLQQQGVANPGQEKTIQTLGEHLIAALRPVDELKNVLLPLNIAQTLSQVFGLTHRLQTLHNKVDRTIFNTHGLPGAHKVQQDVLLRVTRVDERTSSQEQIDKINFELVKKLDQNVGSLQVGNNANSQALNVILKGVEKQGEAVRDAAWRRQNSAELSTQTDVPATYINSQVGTDAPAPFIFTIRTEQAPASRSRRTPTIVLTDSDNDVDESLVAGPSITKSNATRSPSLMDEPQGFSPGLAPPTPQPPVKRKLKRRAPAKKSAASAPVQDSALDDFHSTSSSEDVLESAPAPPTAPPAAHPVVPEAPPKRRKTGRKPNNNASIKAAVSRRISRERKTPVRFGQEPPTHEQDVLVPGTPAATLPDRIIAPLPKKGKSKGKGKGKDKGKGKPEPNIAMTATGQIIDLTVDSLNSAESDGAPQARGPTARPLLSDNTSTQPPLSSTSRSFLATQPNGIPASSFPSAVQETQLSSVSRIQPRHITRSASNELDAPTRQAFFTAQGESLDLDDLLRNAIDEDGDGNIGMLTGSQILGAEDEDEYGYALSRGL